MTDSPLAVVQAAGACLWRPSDRGRSDTDVEVAVIHRPRQDDWTLPKGKLEPGEHLLECAVREVSEETGYHVTLGRPLGTVRYTAATGAPKEVRYWAAEAVVGGFVPHGEVDRLLWLAPDEAAAQLTYEHDRGILRALCSGPVRTTPVLVVRHATAVDRDAWEGDDRLRPLAPEGLAQAERLVPLLDAFGPDAVVSSDSVRCLQTVEPFAGMRGLEVRTKRRLSEQGHRAAPYKVPRLVSKLVDRGARVVLCTHRPVLPDVVQTLVSHGAPPVSAELQPAETLVAHCAHGDVVAVERHRPLPA